MIWNNCLMILGAFWSTLRDPFFLSSHPGVSKITPSEYISYFGPPKRGEKDVPEAIDVSSIDFSLIWYQKWMDFRCPDVHQTLRPPINREKSPFSENMTFCSLPGLLLRSFLVPKGTKSGPKVILWALCRSLVPPKVRSRVEKVVSGIH